MKLNKLLLMVFAGSLFFVSCSNDDDSSDNTPQGEFDNGVFVLNQGGFGHGNASLSFISNDFTLENDVYSGVTGLDLGDTAQDIAFEGDKAYIVVNNSHTVEVVNRYTMVHIATIEDGLDNPRYIELHNGKGYVTNWGVGSDAEDDYVAVIDLTSNTVTSTIAVAEGPEQIIEENGKLYVTHAGGWSQGNTVTVINTAGNTVETTITVGDVPTDIEEENGKIYVLNTGMPDWMGATPSSISVINTVNNTVESTVTFAEGIKASNLEIEDNVLYYTIGSGVYSVALGGSITLPAQPLFNTDAQQVASVSAFAKEDGKFYVADALDNNSNGKVYVYSNAGALLHTFTVGVIPFAFEFND